MAKMIPRSPRGWVFLVALASVTLALGACGSDAGAASVSKAPASAGDVWEIANPDDRAGTAGAMRAYAAGLHVLVLNGTKAYAGMTRLDGRQGDGDAVILTIDGGVTATLTPAGDVMELSFSTGERVTMKKRGGTS